MSDEKGGEEELSADYYYSKALQYLSMEQDGEREDCDCQNCPSDEDDDFSMGFRRQITNDHGHGSASSSGSEAASSRASPTQKNEKPRQRRHSVIERPNISANEFGKPHPKRKLSDGHVHWADEFQKELIRCHPRKTYTRHPSHITPQVKPILKASPEEDDDQLQEQDDS